MSDNGVMNNDVVGATSPELLQLQGEIKLLQKQLDEVNNTAEKTSVACARVLNTMAANEEHDGFVGAGAMASGEYNQYHKPATGGTGGSGSSADGGCCSLM